MVPLCPFHSGSKCDTKCDIKKGPGLFFFYYIANQNSKYEGHQPGTGS